MNRGHGQLGPGVERAGPLAGVTGADKIEFADGDNFLDQPIGFGFEAGRVLGIVLVAGLAAGEPGQDDGFTSPGAGRFDGVEIIARPLAFVGLCIQLDDRFVVGRVGFAFGLFGFGIVIGLFGVFASREVWPSIRPPRESARFLGTENRLDIRFPPNGDDLLHFSHRKHRSP